jgi:GNAT superfamily N-acetyltransferase
MKMTGHKMTRAAQIREAVDSDIGDIVQLINAAFRVESFFVDGDRTDCNKVSDLLKTGKFFLIDDGPKLVGCIYVELRAASGYFGLLSVAPSSQGLGVGRKLVFAAEKYFQDSGCQTSEMLMVNVREELLPFYRKLGYEVSGTSPFPPDVITKIPCHFITMSKNIA